jgi:hypothetical protein
VLPLAQLAAWCREHTRYGEMRASVLRSARRYNDLRAAIKKKLAGDFGVWDDWDGEEVLFGTYLSEINGYRPDVDGMTRKAADKLTPDEEDDLLRLALRVRFYFCFRRVCALADSCSRTRRHLAHKHKHNPKT